jgi:tol-pal system protein YbgF
MILAPFLTRRSGPRRAPSGGLAENRLRRLRRRSNILAPTLVLGLAGLISGCGSGAESLRQDVAQLRQDLNALTLATRRNRGEMDAVMSQLDRRLKDQGGETQKLGGRLDGLQGEVGRLQARLDEIVQRLDAMSRPSGRSIAPAPTPRTPASPTPIPPPSTPPTAVPSPVPQVPPPTASTPSPPQVAARPSPEDVSPEQAYQAAYIDFSRGNYPLAISGFREIVRRFPESPLADKAQYWVGESYYALARSNANQGQADRATQALEQAVQEFRKVALNYPRGEKVPTAIYKEGLALLELKQPKLAQARLQYLLENFPQSEEAPLARERLAGLTTDPSERRREGSSP